MSPQMDDRLFPAFSWVFPAFSWVFPATIFVIHEETHENCVHGPLKLCSWNSFHPLYDPWSVFINFMIPEVCSFPLWSLKRVHPLYDPWSFLFPVWSLRFAHGWGLLMDQYGPWSLLNFIDHAYTCIHDVSGHPWRHPCFLHCKK